MRFSPLLLVFSALFCSATAIPQFLQRVLHYDGDSAAIHTNNAGHNYKASPDTGAAVSAEKYSESNPPVEDEAEGPPFTAPFSQMIARCTPGSYWRCHYRGKLICGCFRHTPRKSAPRRGDNEDNDSGFEDDMFEGYNVTEGDFVGHVAPGNAGSLVPLFRLQCPQETFFYCRYVPGGWFHGVYFPGRLSCGCWVPELRTLDPGSTLPQKPHRCHEKNIEDGSPLPPLDKKGELIRERVNNQNLTSDFEFESLQLGLCRGIDVAFRCCPVCVGGVLHQQCWCRVVGFPCPKVKCC